MGSITDYLENELLDHVYNGSYTPAANLYLALCTADPTDAATGASMNEFANSGSYARTEITFATAASRAVAQDADVDFPTATGDWGDATHYAITDSATHGAGNVLATGALTATKSVVTGNTPSVVSGVVIISWTAGEISDYLSNELLDHAFNNAAYTQPDTYVALVDTTVGDSDTGSSISEPSGGSYARVQVNPNGAGSPTWDTAASGTVFNEVPVEMGTATASWGTIVGVAIVDASSTGNLLMYDNAIADQAIGSADVTRFVGSALAAVFS